jgi:hypothetical protein
MFSHDRTDGAVTLTPMNFTTAANATQEELTQSFSINLFESCHIKIPQKSAMQIEKIQS